MTIPSQKIRSKTWYLLPVFMSIIGGVIAYYAIRNDDPQKAKRCLIIGVSLFLANIAIGIGLAVFLPNPTILLEGTIQDGVVDLDFRDENIEIIMNNQAQVLAIRTDPIVIPIDSIVNVHKNFPEQSSSDIRNPGTFIPDSIKAGTYYTQNDKKEFWFVKTGNSIITMELKDYEFDRVVLESKQSEEWMKKINEKISIREK